MGVLLVRYVESMPAVSGGLFVGVITDRGFRQMTSNDLCSRDKGHPTPPDAI